MSSSGNIKVEELIKLEIEKKQKELDRLKSLLSNTSGESIRICPRCKTKNYHYEVRSNSWVCAFC